MSDLSKIAKKIQKLTLEQTSNVDVRLRHTIEEIGEFAAAVTIEKGEKNKKCGESSISEAVDVVICALSLLYVQGGTTDDFITIAKKKLKKWKKNELRFKDKAIEL
jgi:NTP pyrophosphatase (non-canonical NTP hydrolase)